MKEIGKILIMWLLCLGSCYALETAAVRDDNAIVKQAINAFMEENHIPGVAVELYVNGKAESYYFGYANPETNVPVSKSTIFELGSISKVMTSLLLAQEVDA